MSTQATAAITRSRDAGFALEPILIGAPRADEILVKIAGVGLCHTDLVFQAARNVMKPPAILGHEGAGIVEAVGADVTTIAPGDHVVLSFNSCGICQRCGENNPAYCFSFEKYNVSGRRADGSSAITANGDVVSAHFFGQSSFASHALANARNAIRIDRDLPLALMGPLGCGVQTGAGAIMNALACRKGSSIVIAGGGAVGLSAVMAAALRECAQIIVIEPKAARRVLALELGATHAIDPTGESSLPDAVRAILPHGADYALDASGIRQVIQDLTSCLASHAKFGLVGLPQRPDDALNVPLNTIVGKGFSFIGIIEGDSNPHAFIPELLALYKAGRFPFDRLITTYRLDQINQAIADQRAGKCVKPVLSPD